MQPTLERTITDLDIVLSDTVRCAPVLAALESGEYDCLMSAGTSVRVRDKKGGYFRFVINDAADIYPLTEDITAARRPLIVADAGHEDIWREIYPYSVIRHFRLTVATSEVITSHERKKLPDGYELVDMDSSWEEHVVGLCADKEFDAGSLRAQIRENLSLGLIHQDKRIGFLSTHLNGEFGPMWIAPEYRHKKLGTAFLWEYLCRYFKQHRLGFGLSDPQNIASATMMLNAGFVELDSEVLHITLED